MKSEPAPILAVLHCSTYFPWYPDAFPLDMPLF
jgi:hypothetical protein